MSSFSQLKEELEKMGYQKKPARKLPDGMSLTKKHRGEKKKPNKIDDIPCQILSEQHQREFWPIEERELGS